jgi:hypothetical protein
MRTTLFFAMILAACVRESTAQGVPVHMVVTAEVHHIKEVPTINREDVLVYEGKERLRVTDWVPLRGEHAGLQLYILIDDGLDTSAGSQLDDVRKFIQAQPATTAIGIGYLRNGAVEVAQNLTPDHAAAAKSLRLPLGSFGISASPYLSLVDLIHKWPDTPLRREVLMVTSGIDLIYGAGPDNPYLDRAVKEAQRGGVIVHSIYYGAAGHSGHSYSRINWGQNYLSQLGDETGGEAYWQGLSNPVSFAPFLDDLGRRLNDQYLLTFLAKPETKESYQSVKLRTELPHVELVAPAKVFVPAER